MKVTMTEMIENRMAMKLRIMPVIVMPLLLASPFLIAERPTKAKITPATPKRNPIPKKMDRTMPAMPPTSARIPQMFFDLLPPEPAEYDP